MKDFRINFAESGFSLPDGTNCGVQGEHNAVQLVITLPGSMIDGCDYHVITFTGYDGKIIPSDIIQTEPNADGAYRNGRTIYQPLTAAYTASKTAEIVVTGYKQTEDSVFLVDKTKPVSLWLTPVPGFSKAAYPSGLETTVKGLADKLEAFTSGREGDIGKTTLKMIADVSGVEADTYEDLLKEPLASLDVGTKAIVKNTTKYNRFGFWHGETLQGGIIYNTIYFSPKLPPVDIFLPENCSPEDFRTNATFRRENGDSCGIELNYYRWMKDYAVKVTKSEDSHYFYVYEDKSVIIDGRNHELHEGWNHGFIDTETGLLTYEPSDAPEPLYDVQCSLSYFIHPPEEYADAYRIFIFVCRPDEPYMVTMHRGIYIKESDSSWKMTKETDKMGLTGRIVKLTLKHDAEAWSYGRQTLPAPGAVRGDLFNHSYMIDDVNHKFHITGYSINYDSITFFRDMEQPLPEKDSSLSILFMCRDSFTLVPVSNPPVPEASDDTTDDTAGSDLPVPEPIEEADLSSTNASAPVEMCEHSFGRPVFTYADDYSSAVATITCEHGCGTTQTVEATVTSEVRDGLTYFKATAVINGQEWENQTEGIDLSGGANNG